VNALYRMLKPRSYLTFFLILLISRFNKFAGKYWTIPIYFRGTHGQPTEPLRIRWSSSDARVFLEIFVDQQYSLPESCKSPETILDLGANYGGAGYYFALVCPAARIISLEPSPANIKILTRNSLAFSDRWLVDSRAILAEQRIATFFWSSWHSSGSCSTAVAMARLSNHDRPEAKTARQPCKVYGTDINDLLSQYSVNRISICKMDIEGAEEEVINACADVTWLAHTETLMIEIHDKYFESSPLRALLDEHGFVLRGKRGWEARSELYTKKRVFNTT
jgi:FkbM family methyltransferase